MPFIDPWRGFDEGTQTLRQVTQDQMTNKLNNIKIKEAEQNQAFKAGLRELETLMDRDGVPEEQRMPIRQKYAMSRGEYGAGMELGKMSDLESKAQRRDVAAIDIINKLKGSPLLKNPAFRARLTSAYGIPDATLIDISNEKPPLSDSEKLTEGFNIWSKKQDIIEDRRDQREAARAAREAQKGASPSYMGLDPQYGSVFKLEGKDGLYVMDANSGKFVTRLEAEALNKEQKFKPYNMIPGARANISNFDSDPNKTNKEIRAEAAETKADSDALAKQEGIYFNISSFIKNVNKQIDRTKDLAGKLQTFDAKLLNKPLREIRGNIVGSALQSSYDLYLTSLAAEAAKISEGGTGSVRAPTDTSQKKWEKILDPKLSLADMIELQNELKIDVDMKLDSQAETVDDIRRKLRGEPPAEPKKKETTGDAKGDKTNAAAEAKAAVIMKSEMFKGMKAGDKSVAQKVELSDGTKVMFYKKENGKVGFIPIAGGR